MCRIKIESKAVNRSIQIPVLVIYILALLCLAANTLAQQENKYGNGGITDIFDFPVGARAMALGGAYVSVVDDPYALYWNSAALENVERIGIGIYHTNLPSLTNYDYFSFLYPSLTFGTISAGILRLGTSDIKNTDDIGSITGETSYSTTLFMFGYGFRPRPWFYMGTNFKIERSSLPNYDNAGNLTESALGADLGILIKPSSLPSSQSGFFHGFAIGMNIQNLLQRSQRVYTVQDKTPRNYLFGLSKAFGNDLGNNHFLFAYQMDINQENETVPNYYHFGFEYDFKKILFLRTGYDYRSEQGEGDNGKMTYGMGMGMFGVQLDYSYWTPRHNALSSSHRISLVYNIGKTRKARMAQLQAAELERINEQVRQQQLYERRETIIKGQEQAQVFYDNGDYPRAYTAINRVLALDETGRDTEFTKARSLLNDINNAIEKQREAELDKKISRTQEEAELKRKEQLIREHYDKAMAYFETEDYTDAIRECDQALQIDPNSALIIDLRKTVDEDLRKKISTLVIRAGSLEKSGRQYESIQLYNQARQLAKNNEQMQGLISGQLNKLERNLNRDETIRSAVIYENDQNWAKAAELYKEALKFDPNNESLKQKYNDMFARANATSGMLTGKAKELYSLGYKAFNNGDYDEALRYYEQARELQPLNKTLLRAIDVAKERKQARQAAGSGK